MHFKACGKRNINEKKGGQGAQVGLFFFNFYDPISHAKILTTILIYIFYQIKHFLLVKDLHCNCTSFIIASNSSELLIE